MIIRELIVQPCKGNFVAKKLPRLIACDFLIASKRVYTMKDNMRLFLVIVVILLNDAARDVDVLVCEPGWTVEQITITEASLTAYKTKVPQHCAVEITENHQSNQKITFFYQTLVICHLYTMDMNILSSFITGWPNRTIHSQSMFKCDDNCFKDVIALDDIIEKWNEVTVKNDDKFCSENKGNCSTSSIRISTSEFKSESNSESMQETLITILIVSGASAGGILLICLCAIGICTCRYIIFNAKYTPNQTYYQIL